jgi:hypothetical protein
MSFQELRDVLPIFSRLPQEGRRGVARKTKFRGIMIGKN